MEEKPWGRAYSLYLDRAVELVRIVVRKGGRSSRHYHERKSNSFVVDQGRLQVHVQVAGQSPEVYELVPGDMMLTIPAGVEHQFVALEEDTVAYELYSATDGSPVAPTDIVRLTSQAVCG